MTQQITDELPPTVVSVRDGWQWTCQSGAVVSGLLAAVAAQLLTLFKAPPPDGVKAPAEGAQTVLLIACYSAIFLNISATISSFILIDKLGEIGFKSSSKHPIYDPESTSGKDIGSILKTQEQLMMDYGASRMWKPMLWHCIISLIVAILIYVVMQENLAVKVSLLVITVVNSGFLVFFIIWNVIPGK
ncbi:hypothetical protein CVT25_001532 [Psilocybe cyanescens]|uniref:Uncharacterized protein n=1 Tax=Psilocybe cyanescens TaxID=93625 RepID=A0A409VUQ7_PSICY|nr:hypothetical protein CVT25_001532 [Psilocybe cyanescens]